MTRSDISTTLIEQINRGEISELNLRGQITQSNFFHLCNALRSNRSLRKLDFSANQLSGPQIREILLALKNNPNIESLNLSHNSAYDFPIDSFSEFLQEHRNLKILNLAAMGLKHDVFNAMFDSHAALKFLRSNLVCFDLSQNKLTSESKFDFLTHCKSLRYLDVSSNSLSGEALETICAKFPQVRAGEIHLDLGINALNDSAAKPLAHFVKSNSEVQVHLGLRQSYLSENALRQILSDAESNLTALDLTHSNIDRAKVAEIASFMDRKKPNLRLNLTGNPLQAEDLEVLNQNPDNFSSSYILREGGYYSHEVRSGLSKHELMEEVVRNSATAQREQMEFAESEVTHSPSRPSGSPNPSSRLPLLGDRIETMETTF